MGFYNSGFRHAVIGSQYPNCNTAQSLGVVVEELESCGIGSKVIQLGGIFRATPYFWS